MGNDNKNIFYVEANVMTTYESFSFISLMAPEKKDFLIFFFLENLAFRLPWQPIIISDFDEIHMVGGGPPQKHFCKLLSKYLQ